MDLSLSYFILLNNQFYKIMSIFEIRPLIGLLCVVAHPRISSDPKDAISVTTEKIAHRIKNDSVKSP